MAHGSARSPRDVCARAPATPRASISTMTAAPPLLNPGHWRSLELLEQTSAVHQTLSRYEHAMGHPVYLRPTARGLTVLSLDPSAPAMIGVGGVECCIDRLPPAPAFVASATLAYRAKIEAMTRTSAEERHVIAPIREALAHGLELGGGLLFLHQEWRFPTREKLDVLAVDSRTGSWSWSRPRTP